MEIFIPIGVDSEGNIWTFGGNWNGQLGLGHNVRISIPTQVLSPDLSNLKGKKVFCGRTNTMVIPLGVDNNVWVFGGNTRGELGLGDKINRNVPTQIPALKGKDGSMGTVHTLLLDLNDNLWSFGDNFLCQLWIKIMRLRNL